MPAFAPAWLDPADVLHWLRINTGASGDDDAEVDRVCAETETYVQRCRPEWTATLSPYGSVYAQLDDMDATVTISDGTPGARYSIAWGDTYSALVQLDGTGYAVAAHTYAEPGSFTAVAYNDTANVLATVRLTVPGTGYVSNMAYVPDAETYHGAVMYAARQLRRRNSPAGVESFGDIGITFVTKYDADIERALRTGGWTVPGFG